MLAKNNDIHGVDPSTLPPKKIATNYNEWLQARRKLLTQEKDVLRAYDAMIKARFELPMVQLDKTSQVDAYIFSNVLTQEQISFLSLFREKEEVDAADQKNEEENSKNLPGAGGKTQERTKEYLPLILQYFMWPEGWAKGCGNCSLWTDGIQGVSAQLSSRASFAVVSNVPPSNVELKTVQEFVTTKGWETADIPFLSSKGTSFGTDFAVSQSQTDIDANKPLAYNFSEGKTNPFGCTELPGFFVFTRDEAGNVFLNYSCFARGLEPLSHFWTILDMLPGGRQGQYGVPHKEDIISSRKRKRAPSKDDQK